MREILAELTRYPVTTRLALTGTLVVARDIAASRAAVAHEIDGYLFRTDDEAVAAVARLADDPVLRDRMAAASRATVAARFSPAAEIDGYLAAYERAVAG